MINTQQMEHYAAGILRGGHMLAGVEVPVLVSESHQQSAQGSGVALESGATVTDHVIHQPRTLTVTFSLTNAGVGAGNARDVFESFTAMMNEGELVEIATGHAVYRNMLITGLSHDHSAPYKGALSGTMNLMEVNRVEVTAAGRLPDMLEPSWLESWIPQSVEEAVPTVSSAARLAQIVAKTQSVEVVVGKLNAIPLVKDAVQAAKDGFPDEAKVREILASYVTRS